MDRTHGSQVCGSCLRCVKLLSLVFDSVAHELLACCSRARYKAVEIDTTKGEKLAAVYIPAPTKVYSKPVSIQRLSCGEVV